MKKIIQVDWVDTCYSTVTRKLDGSVFRARHIIGTDAEDYWVTTRERILIGSLLTIEQVPHVDCLWIISPSQSQQSD